MSATKRFNLSYDEELDADIHELLTSIPEKRRSERIRHLIRLGLTFESGETRHQESVATPQAKPQKTVVDVPTDTPGETRQRRRDTVSFMPSK